jgi:mannitol-specific phosphotransferase system IIBC component
VGVKEFLVYTGLRLALFLGSLGIVVGLWAMATGGRIHLLWSVVAAFLISGIASYFLLDRQRAAFAQRVEERAARATAAFDARKAREDQA